MTVVAWAFYVENVKFAGQLLPTGFEGEEKIKALIKRCRDIDLDVIDVISLTCHGPKTENNFLVRGPINDLEQILKILSKADPK